MVVDVDVDFSGREDAVGDTDGAGARRDAQLEPEPEYCGWHVSGSHQAGPVSHCRKGYLC